MTVILVVEDEPLIRLGAVLLVEDAGYEAVEAADAKAAIAILEKRPDIRLVFTDIDMPGTMNGLKLAHYIRRRWPPVHLIMASGKTKVPEADLPPGARFFSKPYLNGAIGDAMMQLLAVK